MKALKVSLFVIFSIMAFSSQGFSEVLETFSGTAFDSKDRKKIVYKETHEIKKSQDGKVLSSTTKYFDSKNNHIATLVCDYSNENYPFLPNVDFVDLRLNYQEKTYLEGGKVIVKRSEDGGKTWKEEELEPEPGLVASQGLNYKIISHFEDLENGNKVSTPFVFPSQLMKIGIRLRKVDQKQVENHFRIRFEVDNFFLRLIAPYAETVYDKVTKRLVSYVGNSNILSKDRNPQEVYITYQYN